MNQSPPTDHPRPQRILWILVGVFAVWAILLAIGATGVFTDVGLFDLRRSLIVLGCAAVFLGFWCWVFTRPRTANQTVDTERSLASPASLVIVGAGYLCWGAAWIVWRQDSTAGLTNTLSWLSLGLMGLSAVVAIIGLSDPRPRRLKLTGLGTLCLLAVATATMLFQLK